MSQAASRAVVVGGASGIGWAVAKRLAAEGRHVTVADRNAEGATHKARGLGAPHDAAHVDVTDEASVAALFDATGPIDVVVNTAGSAASAASPNNPSTTSAPSSTAASPAASSS